MKEAEALRPLLMEEIDITKEPEDEKILELIDHLILEEEITRRLPVKRSILCGGLMFCRNFWMTRR